MLPASQSENLADGQTQRKPILVTAEILEWMPVKWSEDPFWKCTLLVEVIEKQCEEVIKGEALQTRLHE